MATITAAMVKDLRESTGAGMMDCKAALTENNGMLAHILGAEVIWLARFRGENPTSILGDADFPDLASLRLRWDTAEEELRQFVEAVDEGDVLRRVSYRDTRGGSFTLPLGALLQHVANHSTHHRSEVATMLTLIQGSPPGTDLVLYHLIVSGQRKP